MAGLKVPRACFNAPKAVWCWWSALLSVVPRRKSLPSSPLCSSSALFSNPSRPVLLLPLRSVTLTLFPQTARAQSSFPRTPEEASNNNSENLMLLEKGLFRTATSIFQRAEGRALLLVYAFISSTQESLSLLSRSVCSSSTFFSTPPPPRTTTALTSRSSDPASSDGRGQPSFLSNPEED